MEDSAKRLGLPLGAKQLKGMVIAAIIGLMTQYLVLPFVGFGVLTGYNADANTLLMSIVSGLITFVVAFKLAKPSPSTTGQIAHPTSRSVATGPHPSTRGAAATFCTECGYSISGGKFCTNCGHIVS